MGTPDFAVKPLKALFNEGHDIKAVYTAQDKPRGRSGKLSACEVKEAAIELGLKVIQPDSMKTDEVYKELEELAPDVIVVAAFGRIVPKRILDLPKYGCVNVHASLLPAYRGAAPIQWAVLNGEEKSGVTIMLMGEGLDTGDILAQREVMLSEDETSESLFEKLSECGAGLLTDTLVKMEKGMVTPVPQPAESTTEYARMIVKQDGKIDWTRSAAELECFVRGMNSWPGAFDSMNGRGIKIWKSRVVDENTDQPPGSIVKADKNGLFVQTGAGVLSVLELQAEGKKRMAYGDFLRGADWKRGMVFGDR